MVEPGSRGNGAVSGITISGAGSAGPEEAAAIAAAIEHFVQETAPAPQSRPGMSGWQRAALIEGVTARQRTLPPDPGTGFPVKG